MEYIIGFILGAFIVFSIEFLTTLEKQGKKKPRPEAKRPDNIVIIENKSTNPTKG